MGINKRHSKRPNHALYNPLSSNPSATANNLRPRHSKLPFKAPASCLASYIGDCVASCQVPPAYSTEIQTDIASLAAVAQSIRIGIAEMSDERVRHVASWIKEQGDLNDIDFDWAYYGNAWDYGLISWASMGQYEMDFGFGKPVHVRQPVSAFSDGCRILPQMRDGSQGIIIGLEEEDMERLKKDDVWWRWTVEVAV